MTRSNDFERDFSFADEIEDVGFSAFLKDELTGVEADVRRTSDYELMTTWIHPAKERMLSQDAFNRLHCAFLSGYAGDSDHRADRLGLASICHEGGRRRGGLRDRLGVPLRPG